MLNLCPFWSKTKKIRMDSDRKWKVCLIKVPLFLLKNACGASYKPFYIFFVVPLWGHFRMGILTKIKKWKVKCLYFCELQQELYVHNTFLTFSIFQPTLIYNILFRIEIFMWLNPKSQILKDRVTRKFN